MFNSKSNFDLHLIELTFEIFTLKNGYTVVLTLFREDQNSVGLKIMGKIGE